MKPIAQFGRNVIEIFRARRTGLSTAFQRLIAPMPDQRPAHCGNIRTLLMHLCDMDDQLCTWVLHWIAFQLRNPGAKMTTGLIVNGKHPAKTVFFEEILAQLFGTGARAIVADQLHDRFTTWAAEPTALVIVRGAFEPRHAARMRAFITAEDILVEQRGLAPRTRRNRLNFVFLCKSPDFLPDSSSRRFVVIETPPTWPRAFLDAVKAEINADGIEAFRTYLMKGLDMGTFNESTRPLPAPHASRYAA